MPKTYILSPNLSIPPPPSGPLQLGDILPNPFDSELVPLNRKSRLPIPAADLFPADIKRGFLASRSELRGGHFGVWARFLATAFGGGAGIHDGSIVAAAESDSDDLLRVDALETLTFDPTREFVAQSVLGVSAVRDYVSARGGGGAILRTSVFMVTGLKVARGASMASTQSRRTDVAAHAGAPAGIAGVVDVGVGAGLSLHRSTSSSFEESTDFVLAFRVRKVWVDRKGEVRMAGYNKGAVMMDAGNNASDNTGDSSSGSSLGQEATVTLGGDVTLEDFAALVGEEGRVFEDADDDIQWIQY